MAEKTKGEWWLDGETQPPMPDYLEDSIEAMKKGWQELEADPSSQNWVAAFSALQQDLIRAELEMEISPEQAASVRKEILRI